MYPPAAAGRGLCRRCEEIAGLCAAQENPDFRLMQPDDSYYKVFELKDPQPPFGWEEPERWQLRQAQPNGSRKAGGCA